MRALAAALLVILPGACSKKSPDGLPPAKDWNGSAGLIPGEVDQDPHAGIPGAPPIQGNPHEGVPGAPPLGADEPNPHGAPPTDPSRVVAGVIKVHPSMKDRVKPNGVVFLYLRPERPDGTPSEETLAVEKVTWSDGSVAFALGSELAGQAVVYARYDLDGDAGTKEAGDVTGQARVKVPANNVEVTLDTLLP